MYTHTYGRFLKWGYAQVQLEVCPLAPVSKALKAAVAEPCVLSFYMGSETWLTGA